MTSGVLSVPNLIIAGDLNLTLDAAEVWGFSANLNPLADYFKLLFEPTWRNGRGAPQAVEKKLDRFLISEDLVGSLTRYRSWRSVADNLSDHDPIFLQLDGEPVVGRYPYKLNHSWL